MDQTPDEVRDVFHQLLEWVVSARAAGRTAARTKGEISNCHRGVRGRTGTADTREFYWVLGVLQSAAAKPATTGPAPTAAGRGAAPAGARALLVADLAIAGELDLEEPLAAYRAGTKSASASDDDGSEVGAADHGAAAESSSVDETRRRASARCVPS